LVCRQPIGQPPEYLPTGLVTQFRAKPLKHKGWRANDPALPAHLHRQRSQVGQPVVLHGLWQKCLRQFLCRVFAERTQLQLFLAIDGVPLPVSVCCQVAVNRFWEDVDLFRDKTEQGRRRTFADA
jgi:hypothetical protein